jgi:glycosyltransferase involved in cell wall biosynthesis
MSIFINLYTCNVGGGRVIKEALLENVDIFQEETYIFCHPETTFEESSQIKLVKTPFYGRLSYFFLHFLFIPYFIRKKSINQLINFSDVPIVTSARQIYYFDWPYLVYKNSPVWARLKIKERLIKRLKAIMIVWLLRYVDAVSVQTEAMKLRFISLGTVLKPYVVKPGKSVNSLRAQTINKLNTEQIRLFYPTAIYPHKNVEILVTVAKELEKRQLPIQIDITASIEQLTGFRQEASECSLIHFIGWKNKKELIKMYQNYHGIIVPSLLETYCLPYEEALSAGIEVFTSDLDFAHTTLQKRAHFFNPLQPDSIVDCLEKFYKTKRKRNVITDSEVNYTWRNSLLELSKI